MKKRRKEEQKEMGESDWLFLIHFFIANRFWLSLKSKIFLSTSFFSVLLLLFSQQRFSISLSAFIIVINSQKKMWLNRYNRIIMLNSENTFVEAFFYASEWKIKLIKMEKLMFRFSISEESENWGLFSCYERNFSWWVA